MSDKRVIPEEIKDLYTQNIRLSRPRGEARFLSDLQEDMEYLTNNFYSDIDDILIQHLEHLCLYTIIDHTDIHFKNIIEESLFIKYLSYTYRYRVLEENKEVLDKRKKYFALAMMSAAYIGLDCYSKMIKEIKEKSEKEVFFIDITPDDICESYEKFLNREIPDSVNGDGARMYSFNFDMENTMKIYTSFDKPVYVSN